jgi:hypothetical protein
MKILLISICEKKLEKKSIFHFKGFFCGLRITNIVFNQEYPIGFIGLFRINDFEVINSSLIVRDFKLMKHIVELE